MSKCQRCGYEGVPKTGCDGCSRNSLARKADFCKEYCVRENPDAENDLYCGFEAWHTDNDRWGPLATAMGAAGSRRESIKQVINQKACVVKKALREARDGNNEPD